jgi:hypothetical protein
MLRPDMVCRLDAIASSERENWPRSPAEAASRGRGINLQNSFSDQRPPFDAIERLEARRRVAAESNP